MDQELPNPYMINEPMLAQTKQELYNNRLVFYVKIPDCSNNGPVK
jgi:hypothetical protein